MRVGLTISVVLHAALLGFGLFTLSAPREFEVADVEALLATAIGLLAAIPAVVAYNKLSSDAGKLGVRMEGFADEFSAILSRQLEEKAR